MWFRVVILRYAAASLPLPPSTVLCHQIFEARLSASDVLLSSDSHDGLDKVELRRYERYMIAETAIAAQSMREGSATGFRKVRSLS